MILYTVMSALIYCFLAFLFGAIAMEHRQSGPRALSIWFCVCFAIMAACGFMLVARSLR